MKIRTGFVSNSSTTAFALYIPSDDLMDNILSNLKRVFKNENAYDNVSDLNCKLEGQNCKLNLELVYKYEEDEPTLGFITNQFKLDKSVYEQLKEPVSLINNILNMNLKPEDFSSLYVDAINDY